MISYEIGILVLLSIFILIVTIMMMDIKRSIRDFQNAINDLHLTSEIKKKIIETMQNEIDNIKIGIGDMNSDFNKKIAEVKTELNLCRSFNSHK